MNYPSFTDYNILYARYLHRHPKEMFDFVAGGVGGKRVLDICAGSGRAIRVAHENGAKYCVMIEQCHEMVDPTLPPQIVILNSDVISACLHLAGGGEKFDLVVCQQAVNYWLTPKSAEALSYVVEQSGSFVFNTFNERPSAIPRVMTYDLDGRHYVEVSWLTGPISGFIGPMVQHVQICERMQPHVTAFQYLSYEHIVECLDPYFTVNQHVSGPGSVYVCTRK